MASTWERMSKVIERYERLTLGEIRELKKLQRAAIEKRASDNAVARNQIKRLEDQLLNGLEKILRMRNEVESDDQELFDQRIEPIRKQIQSTVSLNRQLPPLKETSSGNPFLNDGENIDESNPYEVETQRYAQESDARVQELRSIAEDAREKAKTTVKIQQDMQDLESIFSELSRIVHEQHEVVDSIEEHVERATEDVKRGNQQLKKAVASKTAKAPFVAAVVGGLALGGPVGVAAGSAVAGVAAGIGGLVAGVYTGRYFKNVVKKDCETDYQ
ncbi:unnamed protein product [Caenorhabditis auriculariae]|uniref:t-SNARE coiled-coil homology domain-containing protein n=1 Tax=Caenorhabditis auriculariae TaxID=2777116 RepID=A0A8S1H6I8_9PELO|nr:unnamed protein product [Caenorhabditis auriculariae]